MKISIIGAPVDLGADRRGVDMGASAIRYAGLEAGLRSIGAEVVDLGNVEVPVPESTETGGATLKYLQPIIDVSTRLAEAVDKAIAVRTLPLVLGGDHSVSLGSVGGASRHRKLGVVWMDAHGDFNSPETSPSGNVHGMVLAALAGIGNESIVALDGRCPKVDPTNIALVGARELDPGERTLLQEAGARVFTMYDVDRDGMSRVMEAALTIAMARTEGLHLSLDLDVVDPQWAPGVGTPVRGGLSYRETHLAMELIARTKALVSMDLVEVNPVLDSHNETARLAVEFALSALGKRIL